MRHRYLFVLAVLLVATSASAQLQPIPNGSFESWTDNTPALWTTNNLPGLVETVTKSTMHTDGQFSLQGEVLEIPGAGTAVPPFLVSGEDQQMPGFPYTDRPASLRGFLASQMIGGDRVTISIGFMKDGQAVGGGTWTSGETFAGLTEFSVPLLFPGPEVPDTAFIMISIGPGEGQSNVHTGSKFFLDGLNFSTNAYVDREPQSLDLDVYYGQDDDSKYVFDITSYKETMTTLEILNLKGIREEWAFSGLTSSRSITWTNHNLEPGMYFLRLTTGEGTKIAKLIIR